MGSGSSKDRLVSAALWWDEEGGIAWKKRVMNGSLVEGTAGEKGESQIGDPRDGPLMRWKDSLKQEFITACCEPHRVLVEGLNQHRPATFLLPPPRVLAH